jgi:hypothetical protein
VTSAVAVVTVVPNQAPVAGADGVVAVKNQAVGWAASVLLANDSDADGDGLAVVAVSGTSTNGGTVVLNGGQVIYTPVTNYVGSDRFTYTVADGYGGTGQGVVLVTVAPSVRYNQVGLGWSNGVWHVGFVGLPGLSYEIQRTTNLVHWVTVGTVTADGNGHLDVADPAAEPACGFYRARRQ